MWPRVIPFGLYMALLSFEGLIATLWVYPIKILMVLAVLLYCWPYYEELHGRLCHSLGEGLLTLGTGMLVYLAWVRMDWAWATIGQPAGYNPFQAGSTLGAGLAGVRLFGASVVVPVMEELFWRSFLLRFLITRFPEQGTQVPDNFAAVRLGTYTRFSFLASVVLFGSEHNLWLAGIMAGTCYTLLLYRTQRLWPCVMAHGVTNFFLGVHVLRTGEWQWW